MKIEKREDSAERTILTAMIVNKTVLSRIASKWERGLFISPWANIIGSWCVDFVRKYGEAPKKGIAKIFENWAIRSTDDATVRLMERFLSSLSDDYENLEEDIQPSHILDLAGEHFNLTKIKRLKSSLEACIDAKEAEKANRLIKEFSWIGMGPGSYSDFLTDQELRHILLQQEEREPVVKYPGPLAKFFRDSLKVDDFVAFLGPPKSGKSYQLMEFAHLALTQRKRVAMFQCGDMTERQVTERFISRIAGVPLRPRTFAYPINLTVRYQSGDEVATVDRAEETFCEGMSIAQADEACEKFMSETIRSGRSHFRLSCHPAGTLQVEEIHSTVKSWSNEGWHPQVILIDYARLLAAPAGLKDSIEIIDKNWELMRAMSESMKSCVVTAEQTNAEAYDARILSRKHFSGSKAILAHCTGMVGINCLQKEKKDGTYRFNWVALREGDFSSSHCIHVAHCLDLAQPIVLSAFPEKNSEKSGESP